MLKKTGLTFTFLSLIINSTFAASNESLEKYFNSTEIKSIQSYKADFDSINSAKRLAEVYKKADKLSTKLNESSIAKIESPNLDLYKWINKYVPGLELTYGAEAQSIYFAMDYQDFMTKAKKTPETSDDVFLKLMIDTYGEHGESYPNWFIMTWDYGGYTLLGKGSHLKKLQKINDALQKSPDFKEYITKVRESLFRDISQSNNFAVPKANVIKEINQILSDKSIDASEKTQLQNRIKQLNKPSKDFQFNCEKENCQYG